MVKATASRRVTHLDAVGSILLLVKKQTELSSRPSLLCALAVVVAFSCSGAVPVTAAEIQADGAASYGEMTSTDTICDFLESPALADLVALAGVDPARQKDFASELSGPLNAFVAKKVAEAGQVGRLAISLSPETQSAIASRVTLCLQSRGISQKSVEAINRLFRKVPFSELSFRQIFLGEDPVRLATAFFVSAVPDGHEVLRNALTALEPRVSAALSAARAARDIKTDEALQSALGGSPAYAQYTCDITEAALYGVSDFNGPGKSVTAAISVEDDGNAIINGKGVKAAKVFPAPSGSDSPFNGVIYGAVDVKNALFSTEGLQPGLLNPSQDELQAFDQMKAIVQGLTDSLFAGRTRYLGISLANDTVFLGDVSPDGNLVNRSTPSCARTR